MERKYVAFISYRHAELDSAVAKQLHTCIEQYVVPKNLRKDGQKKLGIVFRDEEELPISSNLSDEICRALDNAQYLIVVCSQNTAHSPWVGREIEYFLSHHDQAHTLAVLASGEPGEVFPKPLTKRVLADGRVENVEPLAVDVRAKDIPSMKKKLKQEIKRLYAALIGCPYDALVMREQKRKRRQLATVMGLILAVVTSFAAVTLVKNYQIDQKNEELAGMNQTLENTNQELEDKNDELARQKAQVQLRESELLTEKGNGYLAEQDVQKALENFLSALPSDQEERPYYAPAEQGLIASLEIFADQPARYRPFGKVLEQSTPIEAYEISTDGTKIMTLDDYGLVTCFAVSGEVLWTTAVEENGLGDTRQIINYDENGTAIVQSGFQLKALDWQTGETVWERFCSSANKVFLAPSRDVLAYLGSDYTDSYAQQKYSGIFLDPKTGALEQTITFGQSATFSYDNDGLPYWEFPDLQNANTRNGAFSSDSRYFAFFYAEQTDDGGCTEHCMLLDRQTGTFRVAYSRPTQRYAMQKLAHLIFVDEDQSLLCIRQGRDENVPIAVQKIDLTQETLLWELEAPAVEERLTASQNIQVVAGSYNGYLTRGSYMYLLDCQEGQWVASLKRTAPIVSLEAVAGGSIFSTVLENGSYTLGWFNSNGIFPADSYFNQYVTLTPAQSAKLWNEGSLRLDIQDGSVKGQAGGGPKEDYGYVVLVPADNPYQLVIQQLKPMEQLTDIQPISLEKESFYLLYGNLFPQQDDRFLMGMASSMGQYGYYQVDRKTYEVELIKLQSYVGRDDMTFVSDGSGYLTMPAYGDLAYHSLADGSETVLLVNEAIPYPETPSMSYRTYAYSSAYQTKDGRLLTAALGDGKLHYWLDGKDQVTVAVPEDIGIAIPYSQGNGVHLYRFLLAGSNGYIVLADYAKQDEGVAFERFVAYSIAGDCWYSFGMDSRSAADHISLAQEHPWMLTYDRDEHIYIYDISACMVRCQIPLQLRVSAVEQLQLVNKDRQILVVTNDAQILLYDVETGALLYSQQTSYGVSDRIQVAVDEDNQRMYVWSEDQVSSAGACLDMKSWTKLADIPGMLYYDTQRNTIYFQRKVTGAYFQKDVHVMHAPSLEELIAIGNDLLP